MSDFIKKIDIFTKDLKENISGKGFKSPSYLIEKSKRDVNTIFDILEELKTFRTQIDVLSEEYKPVFKKFTYTGDDLTKIEIFTDFSETEKLYNIDFFYDLGNLSSQVITRISDSMSFIKSFEYDTNNNLININLTQYA